MALPFNVFVIFDRFWRSMYNRHENDVHPRETVMDALSSIIDHNDSLQDHIKFLSSVSRVCELRYRSELVIKPHALRVKCRSSFGYGRGR